MASRSARRLDTRPGCRRAGGLRVYVARSRRHRSRGAAVFRYGRGQQLPSVAMDRSGARVAVGGGRLMNAVPSLSVVMPVWNAAPSVARAMESILQQTYSALEFV